MSDRAPSTDQQLRRKRRSRSVYLLPNLFTSASLFCAISSISYTSSLNFKMACWMILLSAVFDALDGPVARLTRSASSFGLNYDSLADVVAFGAAPAFLMLKKLQSIGLEVELHRFAPNLALVACSLFAICGAIRLARFNVQVSDEERKHFTGLPIPGAAGVVVSTFLFIETYYDQTRNLHRGLLVLMVMLSGLMVSNIPFPKLSVALRRWGRNLNALVMMVFLVGILIMAWPHLPVILLGGFTLYVLWSLGAWLRTLGKPPVAAAEPALSSRGP